MCVFLFCSRVIGSVAICTADKHSAGLSEKRQTAKQVAAILSEVYLVDNLQKSSAPSSTSASCQESGSLFCQSPSLREIRAGRLGGRLRRETRKEERKREDRSTSRAREPSAEFSRVISSVSQSTKTPSSLNVCAQTRKNKPTLRQTTLYEYCRYSWLVCHHRLNYTKLP